MFFELWAANYGFFYYYLLEMYLFLSTGVFILIWIEILWCLNSST